MLPVVSLNCPFFYYPLGILYCLFNEPQPQIIEHEKEHDYMYDVDQLNPVL